MTTRFFALRTRIRFVCYASNLLHPYPGEGVAGIFYIDNMANGRKDEAMTEYAPNLGHAVCFPVRKGIAAVNKDIM